MSSALVRKNFPYKHWEYLDHQTGNRLRLVPERGGLITEWRCNGREILYFDLDRFLKEDQSVRGGIPILFPICGGLPQNYLRLEQGNFYINQHGFARDLPWILKSLDNQLGLKMSLADTRKTRALYPFLFLIEMEIRMENNTLSIHTTVQNKGKERMPFCFGLHPYFGVQDLEQLAIKGLSDSCTNHLDMKLTSTKSQLSKISEGIDLLANSRGAVSLVDLKTGYTIEMHHPYPMDLAVVWSSPPRKMVCLEPWTSPRSALISGDRSLTLDPQSSQELFCRFVSN